MSYIVAQFLAFVNGFTNSSLPIPITISLYKGSGESRLLDVELYYWRCLGQYEEQNYTIAVGRCPLDWQNGSSKCHMQQPDIDLRVLDQSCYIFLRCGQKLYN